MRSSASAGTSSRDNCGEDPRQTDEESKGRKKKKKKV